MSVAKPEAAVMFSEQLAKQPWSLPYWVGGMMFFEHIPGVAVTNIRPWIKSKELPTEELHIWEMPIPQNLYVVSLDPSTGDRDPAAIQVVDYQGRQAAESLMPTRLPFQQLLTAIWLAEFYNNAILVIERNGTVGDAVLHWAIERGYKNIWEDRRWGKGFYLTTKIRSEAIKECQQSLKFGEPILRSYRLREQIEAFEKDGPPDDDLVISFVEAHYCSPLKTQMRQFGGR